MPGFRPSTVLLCCPHLLRDSDSMQGSETMVTMAVPFHLSRPLLTEPVDFDHLPKGHVYNLGGGFKYFLFSPLFGEDFQFD